MLDGLPADQHGVWPMLKAGLHFVEDAFVTPALEPFEFVRGAVRLEDASEARGQMTVMVDVVLSI